MSDTRTHLAEAETLIGADDPGTVVLSPVEQGVLGPYILESELGRGGMGVVYSARHAQTGRHVALKVLSPNIPRTVDTVERFLREGQLAAALSHPRSTFIYGAGELDGQLYIAMELVPGRSLAKVLSDDGPLPVATAVDYVLDVTEGLASAHAAGVIHRDVKPSNCFLGEDGRVKVGDYGLSKSLVSDTDLTRTGVFLGTPQFAAPEQVRGGAVDPRTDIYSTAATLYALLTGRGPFTGDAAAVIAQIASDQPRPLRELREDVPRELAAIVARALEKDPAARFADMHQFRQALLPFATGGTSIADVGRRLAAFFIDYLVTGIAASIVGILVAFVGLATQSIDIQDPNSWFQTKMPLIVICAVVAYFAVAEGRYGCGIGKRLMGLRVVDGRGESPRAARAWLRALLLPGVTSLPSIVAPSLIEEMQYSGNGSILGSWLNTFVGWGMTLLFLSTMRNRNGYRGIHELLSGTRVVRPQTAVNAQRLSGCAVIAPVEMIDELARFGPYAVTGRLGFSGKARFLAAVDQSLHREVWIRVAPADQGVPIERVGITRPARPFWLNSGDLGEERWDAFEAVNGAPIDTLIGDDERGRRLKWSQSVGILLQLSEELADAADDESLPSRISAAHVWVEPDGRVKLLDEPLECEPGEAAETPGDPSERPAQAARLLRELTLRCARGQPLAEHAQQLVDRLREMPDDRETLHWSQEQFRDVSHRPSILRWDDRLGVLATSIGLEQGVYLAYAVSVTTACLTWLPAPLPIRLALSILLAVAPPAILGAWLRGGPAFRLTGISVRHRHGPASRIRCGWRGLIAWLPSMVAWSLLATSQTLGTEDVRAAGVSAESGLLILMMVSSLGFSFLYLIHIVLALLTIPQPSRGVQDLLSGTSLVPR